MASNLVVARGGVEYVPPISLAFWRWTIVFSILLFFNFQTLVNKTKIIKKEIKKLFFLGAMGCGVEICEISAVVDIVSMWGRTGLDEDGQG